MGDWKQLSFHSLLVTICCQVDLKLKHAARCQFNPCLLHTLHYTILKVLEHFGITVSGISNCSLHNGLSSIHCAWRIVKAEFELLRIGYLVEANGFEPLTSYLQSRRSTN